MHPQRVADVRANLEQDGLRENSLRKKENCEESKVEGARNWVRGRR
jgi:hypothetical protein